jgi:hypothetical protein
MKLSIDVYPDYIVIEDYTVPRPTKISPSQWLEYWKDLLVEPSYCGMCEDYVRKD